MDTRRDSPSFFGAGGRARPPRALRGWPALLAALYGCASEPPPQPSPSLPVREVRVVKAVRSSGAVLTEVVGTVRSAHDAAIASLVSGTVTEVRVGLGSFVRAGQVLVRLSAHELESRRDQARAVAARAAQDRDRAAALRAQDAITVAEYEAALTQWSVARAQEDEASTVADRTVLRAPFGGVITAKLVNVGETALPGRPLLTLESRAANRFEAQVPESASGGLAVGQALPVRIDGLDRELPGRIAELHPSSDDVTRARLVKIDLPETPGLRAGQFGRVLFAVGRTVTVTVPTTAVVHRGQLESVFVVDAGTVRLRLVRCGRELDGRAQISAGLVGGEMVALASDAELVDGQHVSVPVRAEEEGP